jgi:hypothetical protein
VNNPQATSLSGGYCQRPEVFSEKFSFLLSLLWAGRFTRKEDCVGTRCQVDADRILREVCGGTLVATTHKDTSSKGGADVTTTVTAAHTATCAFRAARSTYWFAEWRLPRRHTLHALLSLWAGRITYWFASAAPTLHTLLARALVVVVALGTLGLIRLGPSYARDGGQRSPYQGSTHQLERLTSRDVAAS